MTESPSPTQRVARLFDEVATEYDQTGVDFFGPIADRLVDLLQVRPGERAADLGCGRGAATFRLADAVGPTGSVTAVDVAPAMAALTRARAEREGRANVRVETMDASAPNLPEHAHDVVASSLVLFFLPEPAEALTRWLRLLAPNGRIGVTTFGAQDPVWKAVDDLLTSYLPPGMLDARTSGARGPFASDRGMQDLVVRCGAAMARTVTEPQHAVFADADAWRAWSMSAGQRLMWGFVPEPERELLFARITKLLGRARGHDGRIRLTQDVRYTLATAPG